MFVFAGARQAETDTEGRSRETGGKMETPGKLFLLRGRMRDRQTDRQTDRQAERQTGCSLGKIN